MGPLKGFKIIEMAGIGPGPFCGMILADLGAEIIRVDRASAAGTGSREEPANRGKKSIAVDLKSEDGVEVVLKLVESAFNFDLSYEIRIVGSSFYFRIETCWASHL